MNSYHGPAWPSGEDLPDDLFDLDWSVSNDFEAALENQQIRKNKETIRQLEEIADAGGAIDIAEEIAKMDRSILPLINQHYYATGEVTYISEGNEVIGSETIVDGCVFFLGYTRRPGPDSDDVRFGYAVRVTKTPEGKTIDSAYFDTLRKNTEDDEEAKIDAYGVYAVATTDLIIDFPISTPEQALAWLSLVSPETIDELDQLLIVGEADPEDEDRALRNLGQFRLRRPDDMLDATWNKMKHAVMQYAVHMVTVDSGMPYLMTVSGNVLIPSSESVKPTNYQLTSPRPFHARALVLMPAKEFDESVQDAEERVFALTGSQVSRDVWGEDVSLFVPLSALTSFVSMRNIEFR